MKFAIIGDPKLKAEIKQNRELKVMLTSVVFFSRNIKPAGGNICTIAMHQKII